MLIPIVLPVEKCKVTLMLCMIDAKLTLNFVTAKALMALCKRITS